MVRLSSEQFEDSFSKVIKQLSSSLSTAYKGFSTHSVLKIKISVCMLSRGTQINITSYTG